LGRRPASDIIGFADHHAEALHRLDQERFGLLPVVDLMDRDGNSSPQSADQFLYARCAVVAAGRAVWEDVFFDVDKFAPFTSTRYGGEWLLYVPDQAYELVTGQEWDRSMWYCYETFSNKDGWPNLQR
jgi:hypothetical protein